MADQNIKNALSSQRVLTSPVNDAKTLRRQGQNLLVLTRVFGMQYNNGVLTMPNNRLFGFDQEGG